MFRLCYANQHQLLKPIKNQSNLTRVLKTLRVQSNCRLRLTKFTIVITMDMMAKTSMQYTVEDAGET